MRLTGSKCRDRQVGLIMIPKEQARKLVSVRFNTKTLSSSRKERGANESYRREDHNGAHTQKGCDANKIFHRNEHQYDPTYNNTK